MNRKKAKLLAITQEKEQKEHNEQRDKSNSEIKNTTEKIEGVIIASAYAQDKKADPFSPRHITNK